MELRNREEVSAIASVKKLSDKRKGLNEVRALIRPDLEDIESGGPTFDAEVQAKEFVEKEFELMKKLCEVLFDQKRYPELQRITFSALGSPIFNKHTEIIKVKNLLETQWARKFKKVQTKKLVKSNKSISQIILFDQIPFFAISKMTKNQFLN